MIPVFKPSFDESEVEALREVFATGWIGAGPKTREFENQLAAFVGVPHAIGVNSATSALHLALHVTGVAAAEVITTSLTFVSTNHAILYAGGIPVFADVDPETLNLDPIDIRRRLTPRTRAIVVVHYGGHACAMDEIVDIARERNLKVIEDNAHGCGGSYRGRMLGSLGDFGCFSFHAVKNLATGDGGMITTRDSEVAGRLRRLAWLGINQDTWQRASGKAYSWSYEVEELGFKYHMNDIAAGLGLVQLAKLDRTNARRRGLADRYRELLADLAWLTLPPERDYARSAWHNFVVKVADPDDRNRVIDHLNARGISAGVHYFPNHLYRMYRPYAREALPVTESVWQRLITLPLFPDLTDSDQDQVVDALRTYRQ